MFLPINAFSCNTAEISNSIRTSAFWLSQWKRMSEQLSAASFLSGCEAAMYVSTFRIGILIITFLSLAKQYKILEDHSSGLKGGKETLSLKSNSRVAT